MNQTAELWLKRLGAAFITGASHAGSAWVGLAVGNSAGLQVPMLDWQGLVIIMVTSGALKVLQFLQKKPLPGVDEDGDKDESKIRPIQ